MNAKYSFSLSSDDSTRKLPGKIIIGQNETETTVHVGLKLLGFVFFYRERLQLETRLPHENIPYVPDLAVLDYELRPVLWVECGECSLAKLQKLAVKAPEAEIWVVKRSEAAAEELLKTMAKQEFRTGRYHIIGLDQAVFEEMIGLFQSRNDFYLYRIDLETGIMQFELNKLWFEFPFSIRHY